MKLRTKAQCPECGRVFDLTDENDADEWFNGHDCEAGRADVYTLCTVGFVGMFLVFAAHWGLGVV